MPDISTILNELFDKYRIEDDYAGVAELADALGLGPSG